MHLTLKKVKVETELKVSIVKSINNEELREEFSGKFEKNEVDKSGFNKDEMEDMKIWHDIRKDS